jgi:hypothetical protein
MLPVVIEDLIGKLLNKNSHPESRQFYETTLRLIKSNIDKALEQYEKDCRVNKR